MGLGIPSWILLVLFSMVPVVFATGFSQFEILKNAVLVGGSGAALAVWAATVAWRGRATFTAGRVLVLAVVAALYVAASVGWSPGVVYGSSAASSVVALFGIVVVMASPVGRAIRFVEFATAVSVGMALAALTGVLDLVGSGLFTAIWDPPGFTGAFDSMEFAVAYYGVSVPIAIAGTQHTSGRQRIGFAVASVLGALHFGLVANWTYLGLFAAVSLTVAVLIVVYEGFETLVVLSPVGAMVGLVVFIKLVAGAFWAGPSDPTDATSLPVMDRAAGVQPGALRDKQIRNPTFSIDRMESVRSMETRGYLTEVAFDLIRERPVFGHGAGAWWRLQTKHPNEGHHAVQGQFTHYPAFRSPHSIYGKLLVEYGAFGFALFFLWFVGCATIALGALGRTGDQPELVVEQWGLWGAVAGGLAFGVLTPLLEVAPAAAVWFGAIAVWTRRSAEVNGYQGASQQWRLGGEEGSSTPGRVAVGAVAGGLAAALVVVTVADTVSRLYRGWGDQLMLRTYYERAVERYETAHEWFPARGGVLYNISLAEHRLGTLGESELKKGSSQGGPESGGSGETAPSERPEGESAGDVGPDRDDGGRAAAPGARNGPSRARGDERAEPESESDSGTRAALDTGTVGTRETEPDTAVLDAGVPGDSSDAGNAPEDRDGGDESNEDEIPKMRSAKILASPGHERLKRTVAMRPHDTRVLDLIARFYLGVDFGTKALEFGRRAVEAYPNNVPARRTLASALQSVGRLEETAKVLLETLDRNPPDSDRYRLHFQLGQLYFRGLEELQHAKEHFRAAQEKAGDLTRARRAKKKVEAVQKQIEYERKLREGKNPEESGQEGSKPPGQNTPPSGN